MNTVLPEVIEADEVNRSRLLWIAPDDRGLSLEIVLDAAGRPLPRDQGSRPRVLRVRDVGGP